MPFTKQGVINLLDATASYKLALYTGAVDQNTSDYTTVGEATGAGYTAGGYALTGATKSTDSVTGSANLTFSKIALSGVNPNFSWRYGLIYNTTNSDTVCFFDKGAVIVYDGTAPVDLTIPANLISVGSV